ncbi:hypothetical protein K443DRAFT_674666 [Laccaria amethystina LaAM-08-1]|jgi:hypothetical protein|uniref:Uncharacterized protein n=1 Tax=Laccaria amethystina LaAM-08-1 TaxID=1095629 RepID=A0A0C9YD45_9AGAR|nr:hypothetical protein K443DRAFT_674666 [Laccaria amethystina LaAM-08-1]
MTSYSASAFTQSAPQVSSDSSHLDENIRIAANTCTGVQHHVADIAVFLTKVLRCSFFAERHRMFVQDPLPFFIAKIVNATTPHVLDMGAVIDVAHILLMRLFESNRFAGAAWSGHQLFLSAFSIAAQQQPDPHAAVSINNCVFWSKLSKFTVEEVHGMQRRLFGELKGQVWVFSEVMEKVMQSPLMQLRARWRQEDEEIRLEKRSRSLRGRLATFLRCH